MYNAHDFHDGAPVERFWLVNGIEQTANLLKSVGVSKGTILDVGCNTGEAVEALCAQGFDAEGCDIDEAAITAGRERGRRIFAHNFESNSFPRRYAAIICIHTLEHLLNPRLLVQRASDALEPGGILLIVVPNHGGLVARAMGAKWGFLQPAEHVWQFTPSALRMVVERDGKFRQIRSSRRNHLEYMTNFKKRTAFAVARLLNMSDEIRAVFIRLPDQRPEHGTDMRPSMLEVQPRRREADGTLSTFAHDAYLEGGTGHRLQA